MSSSIAGCECLALDDFLVLVFRFTHHYIDVEMIFWNSVVVASSQPASNEFIGIGSAVVEQLSIHNNSKRCGGGG